MTRDDIAAMAWEAGLYETTDDAGEKLWVSDQQELERFVALVAAAERNKLAAWMMARGYATGHGDTVEGLLTELEWQIEEREREACAKVCDDWPNGRDDVYSISVAIRARGKT